jgi:hypothetical protein
MDACKTCGVAVDDAPLVGDVKCRKCQVDESGALDADFMMTAVLPFVAGIAILLIAIGLVQYRSNANARAMQRENDVYRANEAIRSLSR